MLGFINVYKPSGITSNAVVQKIKKRFGIKKIGHMGTLDPLASGILPIAVGKATRLFDLSLNKTKRYIAEFEFGYTTDTLDITGNKTATVDKIPTIQEIQDVLPNFLGLISQVPPNFSAKNINGQRAYDLARQGIEFELKPKDIEIFDIKVIEQVSTSKFKFDITCSSGTYIRSIARDIATQLGTLGCMTALERVETGNFNLQQSVTLDKLLESNIGDYLLSPLVVFDDFNVHEIPDEILVRLLNGLQTKYQAFKKPTFIVNKNQIVGVAKCNEETLSLQIFLYE